MGKTRKRVAQTAIVTVVAFFVALAIFGRPGAALVLPLALLAAAFRHDDDLGTWFPLAILFLIMFLFLTMLIFMLSMLASR